MTNKTVPSRRKWRVVSAFTAALAVLVVAWLFVREPQEDRDLRECYERVRIGGTLFEAERELGRPPGPLRFSDEEGRPKVIEESGLTSGGFPRYYFQSERIVVELIVDDRKIDRPPIVVGKQLRERNRQFKVWTWIQSLFQKGVAANNGG